MQYLLLWLFFFSEVRYVKQNVPGGASSNRTAYRVLSVYLVLITLVAVVVAAYRLIDDSVAVWRDGLEAGSMVAVLFLQIYATSRNVDHVFLFTYWTLRTLALSIDVAFDRTDAYDLVHLILAFVWLCVCGVRSLLTNENHSGTGLSTPREPNLVRSWFFSWLDHTYREAHRGSESFYEGKLFGSLPDDRRCETLLEAYEKSNAKRGYTAVDDGSGRKEKESHRFTIRRLLIPFRRDIVLSGVNRFALIVFYFLCPYLLRVLLEENQSRMYQKWIVAALFYASITIAILNTQYQHATQDIGLRIKSILMGAIYRSILAEASTSNTSSATLTTDTMVFVPLVQEIHMMWSGPLIIIVTFVALWAWVIGPSGIVGLTIMVIVIYITKRIAQKISNQEKHIKRCKDDRVRLTTNSIEQMQQIKSDLLEEYFEQQIDDHRRAELRHMRTFMWYDALKYLLSIVTPTIVACGTFLFMYLEGSGALLTVQSMFVAIALFNITRYPMSVIPNLMTNWRIANEKLDAINAIVCGGKQEESNVRAPKGGMKNGVYKGSLEKMQDVVHTFVDQLEDSMADSSKAEILKYERAQFSIADRVILRDISMKLRAGTFTGISGTHGSGKTTLVRAMIGTVSRTAGTSTITWNSVSYCPQTPWIHSGTIRSNILFGQEYEQDRYEEVLRACCLEEDLKTFQDYDERVVSEGGHSLSGGQARRVSLARAVYRRADVYLFDDPLRSLDPNVSRTVFENVFHRTNGLLAGCTCVFISHDPEHYAIADKVLVMAEGTIEKVLIPADIGDQLADHIAREDEMERDEQQVAKEDPKLKTKRTKSSQGKSNENSRGSVSLKLYANFARLLKLPYYGTVVLLEILTTGLDIVITTLLAQWAASDKQSNRDLLSTSWIVCIWSCAVLLKTVLLQWGGLQLSKFVHSRMLSTILRQPMEFFDRNDSGVVVNRFANDLNIVDVKIITNLRAVLSASFSVLGTLGLFVFKLYNKPLLFVVALSAAVFLVFGLKRLLSYHLQVARTLKRFEASSRSPIILQYNETIQGIDTIKAYDAEGRFLRQFLERIDTHQNYIYHNNSANRWIGIRLEFIGAMVIYYVALLTVSNQSMVGLAFVGIIVSYVLRLIPSLNSLLLASGLLEENIISFERVAQYLDLPRETTDETGVGYPTSGQEKLPVRGPIEYRDVSLTYSDGSTVLHNLTLTIGAGEKLGIVGRTGSGKSSFIGTLFRFYPKNTSGTILIAGVGLKAISLRKLRNELTLVPQSTSLFSGLVQNFIDPWKAHTVEQLQTIMRECELASVSLGATLQELSDGQRQLLCLVRGLLRRKPIIILDEATSGSMTFEEFCGGPFWDDELTWREENPDLTFCFQRIILQWTPCFFLFVFSIYEVLRIVTSRYRDIPWNWFNITKMIFTFALMVMSWVDLGVVVQNLDEPEVFDVQILVAIFNALAYIMVMALYFFYRKYGIRSTGTMFIFWFLKAFFGIIQMRTEAMLHDVRGSGTGDFAEFQFVSYTIQYTFTCCVLLMELFPDKEPRYSEWAKLKNPNPELRTSFFSRLFYLYFDSYAWRGFRKPLTDDDMYDLNPEDTSRALVPPFDKYWFESVEKGRRKQMAADKKAGKTGLVYKPNAATNGSVLPAMVKAYGGPFWFAGLLQFAISGLQFASPYLMQEIMAVIALDGPFWKGMIITLGLFLTSLLIALFNGQYFHRTFLVGFRIRTGLISAIYRKALRISSFAKKDTTVGEIVNLMAVDAQRFFELTSYLHVLWSAPLIIALCIYLLYELLGPAVFAGLGVMHAAYYGAGTYFVWTMAPFLVTLASFAVFVMIDEENVLDPQTAFVALALFNILRFPLAMFPMMITFAMQAWVSIKRIDKFMNSEELDPNNVTHNKSENALELKDGTFSWGDDAPTLKNINLALRRGKLSAVVGGVGTGKSSLISALLEIFVMKDGEISESGSYQELLDQKGAFAEFLTQHIQEMDDEDEDELKLIQEVLKDGEAKKIVQRAMSTRSQRSGSSNGSIRKKRISRAESRNSNKPRAAEPVPQQLSAATLIEKEESATGAVGYLVYVKYFKGIGLWLGFWSIFFSVINQGASIYANIWLTDWSEDPEAATDNSVRDMYLGVYGGLGGAQSIALLIASITLALGFVPAFLVIYYLIQKFYIATSRQLKRLESVTRSPIYSHFGESITGQSTIRAYGQQDRFMNESEQRVDYNQLTSYPSIIANRWLAVRLELVGALVVFFAALFAMVARDDIGQATVGLSISYALQISATLSFLVRMTAEVETNIVAIERLEEYTILPREAEWQKGTVDKTWPAEGKVEFKDYQIRYREGLDLVIRGISLNVRGGEKIGIVGRTGAGKSSLTLGLFRSTMTFEDFCGGPFWDEEFVWDIDNPNLTFCFQRVILQWVPCAFLFVFSIYDILKITESRYRDIPWNWYNLSKMLVIFLLMCMSWIDLGMVLGYQDEQGL
uniref:ABC-type glutathione-S-conjugate transporter n=2 Tax=Anopheles stephensi TaxID=30069 RepID=A0A182Y9Z9_ANOST